MKRALITGIFGQDGSYLCEQLSREGYEVHGIARRDLSENSKEIREELGRCGVVPIVHGIDLYSTKQVQEIIREVRPNELYHVAAQHVSSEGTGNGEGESEQTMFIKNVTATANILEACETHSKETRIISAGSCLMFDGSDTEMQNENTPFETNSLYGLAKITEASLVNYYRKKGLYVCTAILYNHESHRRAKGFVTKKIVSNMVAIVNGAIERFSLGDITVRKDWGFAGDYADAMIRMCRATDARDYILSSGETHTVRDFIEMCAEELNLSNWQEYIDVGETDIQRRTVGLLFGDPSAAEKDLKWKRGYSLRDIVHEMVLFEVQKAKL